MKRVLVLLLTVLTALTVLAVPSAALPPEPIEPPDPPPPSPAPGPDYSQRWASLMADQGFQELMALSGEAQYQTTMDGLRSLVADEMPAALAQAGDGDALASSELETARQEVLDLLVMPESQAAVQEPEAPAAMASSGITAQDPFFCTPAFRGNALHASLPGPYGEFAANGANNFCLPNGPYGNDLCTAVPDRGYVFDFRRACYQHDMAYFWTPLADRSLVDGQFLLDMIHDCRTHHPWYSLRRYACFTVAGFYYLGVRAFGGGPYNNRQVIPGYSRPRNAGEALPVFRPFVLPGTSTCLQFSHAWVHNASSTIFRGTTLYPTGVVAAGTRVVFDFVNPTTGQIVARHVTQPSRLNCVVHHEPEAFSSWNLPPGRIDIYAKFTRWEAVEDVRILVHSVTVV